MSLLKDNTSVNLTKNTHQYGVDLYVIYDKQTKIKPLKGEF